jgi:Fur family ferric uptake transcriptional regulator
MIGFGRRERGSHRVGCRRIAQFDGSCFESHDELKLSNKPTELKVLREIIRGAGLRSTQARLAILRRLRDNDGPLTHAQMTEELESRDFDKATIYRSLVEMAEAGLLTRMELGDRVWRYELRRASPAEQPEHLHFLCVDCGKIECLDGTSVATALTSSIRSAANGTISEVLLKGHCQQCQ